MATKIHRKRPIPIRVDDDLYARVNRIRVARGLESWAAAVRAILEKGCDVFEVIDHDSIHKHGIAVGKVAGRRG